MTSSPNDAYDFSIGFPAGDNNLVVDLFHNYENQLDYVDANSPIIHNCVSNTTQRSSPAGFVDFIFNRTKAFYSQYPSLSGHRWYYNLQYSYTIPVTEPAAYRRKIFIAGNKTWSGTRKFRQKLVSALRLSTVGHTGNYDDGDCVLYPQSEHPTVYDIDKLTAQKISRRPGGYDPIHNAYYNDTFISLYGETIEYGHTIVVTEKTYDPLIKGHFILPFSTHGFIAYLRRIGIRFPDFIDYSYDDITDDDERYNAYEVEINKLISKDMSWWRAQYDANRNILLANQIWFHEKPYDRIDLRAVMGIQ